ncbi:MAG TPA: polysaccharide deacetylase family protein, partial [Solirubrobacteraceae bacterium]|nr:polysaccharide deacetylase family protein [Solirubrobacteraceae bacterium]
SLLARGVSCSVFVPTGLIGRRHPDVPSEPIMTGEEIREFADAGVEFGAHSVDHLRLAGMSYEAVIDQMRRSRAELEDVVGRPVRTMAYPYGSHDVQTMRAAAEAGFECACACSGPERWLPYSVPREPVYPSVSPLRLRLKIAGLYGPAHALVAEGRPLSRWRQMRTSTPAEQAHVKPERRRSAA